MTMFLTKILTFPHLIVYKIETLITIVFVIGECPPHKHLYTNCTDPCKGSGGALYCPTDHNAICKPDYCGGCITRFFNNEGIEVHCKEGT